MENPPTAGMAPTVLTTSGGTRIPELFDFFRGQKSLEPVRLRMEMALQRAYDAKGNLGPEYYRRTSLKMYFGYRCGDLDRFG